MPPAFGVRSFTPWARAFSLITAPFWRCFGRTPVRFLLHVAVAFGCSSWAKRREFAVVFLDCYGLVAVVMAAQVHQLAPPSHRKRAMATAALLAFCSPYPVRFAIEGKSYAFLVLLVALGWWMRSRLLVQHLMHGGGRVAGCL